MNTDKTSIGNESQPSCLGAVINSTVYLTSSNYYGDGQFYFKCKKCGEELCGRRTETIECMCGLSTDCIYDYE